MSPPRPLPSEIIEAVCREWDVPKQRLIERRRPQTVNEARHVAFYLMRRFGYSLTQCGHALQRDHTTVVHAGVVVRSRIAGDPALAARIERLALVIAADVKVPRVYPMVTIERKLPPELSKLPSVDPAQVHDLRRRRWSLNGIAKRLGIPPEMVAPIIGVRIGGQA